MLKLFVSQSLIEVESRKEILDQEGILCTIKNQQGSSLAGEVPFAEVFPELWVINDDEFQRAKGILDKWDDASPSEGSAWTCTGCSEHHTGEFTTCWKCGRERLDS
ncbi:putative signal transducing protein [Nitrospira sp. M1]